MRIFQIVGETFLCTHIHRIKANKLLRFYSSTLTNAPTNASSSTQTARSRGSLIEPAPDRSILTAKVTGITVYLNALGMIADAFS